MLAGVAIAVPATVAAAAGTGAAATVYVAPDGSASAGDHGCNSAGYSSIQSAVSAVPAGGVVVVCGGSYDEDVTVPRRLSLIGEGRPVIDAVGQINGVLVKAPDVKITGFTVTGAVGEGILIDAVNSAVIEHNVVTGNDRGGLPVNPVPNSYPECQTVGGVPGDCGEGIHLMGSSFSVVAGNTVKGNTGGILLSDETGPTAHNRVTGNLVTGNLYDCGVTVVGHNPHAAPGGVPAPATAGVYDNLISGNTITGNGTKGEGAGVVLATPFPGGAVYDNTVSRNRISGNGMSGVTLHSHAPGQFLNGNVITGNQITVNNLKGDGDFPPPADEQTTGVLAATAGPLTISVYDNVISGDHFGIWTTGPVTVTRASDNLFPGVAVPVAHA